MEELIILLVMESCKFADTTVNIENRVECMEQYVNCIVSDYKLIKIENKDKFELCKKRIRRERGG